MRVCETQYAIDFLQHYESTSTFPEMVAMLVIGRSPPPSPKQVCVVYFYKTVEVYNVKM